MPSLYLRGQLNLVLLQLPVRLLVICHEQQQSLARWPLKEVEVVLKVGGKLRAGVIGKIGVQGEYQTRECVFLLQLLDGPRLKQTPCHASERSHDVQHTLIAPLRKGHLSMVQMDPLAPFLVLGRLAGKQGHVAVSKICIARALPRTRGRCSLGLFCGLAHDGSDSEVRLVKVVLDGLKAVKAGIIYRYIYVHVLLCVL